MSKAPTRLIVSFVGHADLRVFGIDEREPKSNLTADGRSGPIVSVLMHLANLGLCHPASTRLMLFDDRPQNGARKLFREELIKSLPGMGIAGLPVDLAPIELPKRPTDLDALYRSVWAAIPTGENQAKEVLFNLSSGTPAMQVTQVLAASCLPLARARLFESSIEGGVLEVKLPYVIATREDRGSRARERPTLPSAARAKLIEFTVVDDPLAEAAFAILYKAASQRARAPAPAAVILGPTGSGKWHAARQFGRWIGGALMEVLSAPIPREAADCAAVLIHRIDRWPADALATLTAWRVQHPDVAIAATWRTDETPAVSLEHALRDGLQGTFQVWLPSINARIDIQALAEAVSRQSKIWNGKLKERLQYDLLTDLYVAGLHDLKAALAGASIRSKGSYPDRGGYIEARKIRDSAQALALLRECYQTLTGLRFGPGLPTLKQVMQTMETAVVQHALSGGLSQGEAAKLLGFSQQKVSKLLDTGEAN